MREKVGYQTFAACFFHYFCSLEAGLNISLPQVIYKDLDYNLNSESISLKNYQTFALPNEPSNRKIERPCFLIGAEMRGGIH